VLTKTVIIEFLLLKELGLILFYPTSPQDFYCARIHDKEVENKIKACARV